MLKTAARLCLERTGWSVHSELPPGTDKFVVIAAPHTSNWDFPLALAVAAVLEVKFYFVGKHTLFRPPFGGLMRKLGGIPVHRQKTKNFVAQVVEIIKGADRIALAIAPEGTRSRSEYWRSGFYHIARGAGVPIVPGYVDYKSKTGGLGAPIDPSQPKEAVMDQVRAFYADKSARRPELYTEPRLRDERGD